MRSRYGRRAFRASPIRCVGERIKVTGVPEFREVAWRACVDLNAKNTEAQTSTNRPLQGHSPHIFNLQFGYDNPDWGTRATLLYNFVAESIVSVGLLGAPDKFLQPLNQLDFIASQDVNDWLSLQLKMKNLINPLVEVKQGDEVTRSFRRGREFTIGVTLNF